MKSKGTNRRSLGTSAHFIPLCVPPRPVPGPLRVSWVYRITNAITKKIVKTGRYGLKVRKYTQMMASEIRWLSTIEAAKRLGVSLRTLYKFIDEGLVPGYKFGRVIRLQEHEVDAFIVSARIEPGSLEHLYPEAKGAVDVEV